LFEGESKAVLDRPERAPGVEAPRFLGMGAALEVTAGQPGRARQPAGIDAGEGGRLKGRTVVEVTGEGTRIGTAVGLRLRPGPARHPPSVFAPGRDFQTLTHPGKLIGSVWSLTVGGPAL